MGEERKIVSVYEDELVNLQNLVEDVRDDMKDMYNLMIDLQARYFAIVDENIDLKKRLAQYE